MARVSSDPLQPNPFTTYRDPKTGRWIVVESQPKLDLCVGKNLESSQTYQVNAQSSTG
jgi:hypothetical protein